MSRLIDPDEPLDLIDEEELDARMPPQWQPEPEPEIKQTARAILAASTDYDEDLPF